MKTMITELCFYSVQILLQLFAISIVTYQLGLKINNGSRVFWKWFLAGFVLQLLRRVLAIVWLLDIPFPEIKGVTLLLVPTGVSLCYAIAMFEMSRYVKKRREILRKAEKKTEDTLKKLSELDKMLKE